MPVPRASSEQIHGAEPAAARIALRAPVDREESPLAAGCLVNHFFRGCLALEEEDMAAAMDVANPGAAASSGLDSCLYTNELVPNILPSGSYFLFWISCGFAKFGCGELRHWEVGRVEFVRCELQWLTNLCEKCCGILIIPVGVSKRKS